MLQFLLLGLLLVVAWWGAGRGQVGAPRWVLGCAGVVAGAAVMVWAARTLGSALVPWPRPVGDRVVRTGPYRYVRHPIYTGGLLACAGAAVATTWWALVPAAALAVVWGLKCRVEERMLARRFPDYADYSASVRWRLVPGVY